MKKTKEEPFNNTIIRAVPVSPLMTNCYLIGCKTTKETFIVDPGYDDDVIVAAIEKESLKPSMIINTHGHADHVGAVEKLKKKYRIKFGIHREELGLLSVASETAMMLGFDKIENPRADFFFSEGEILKTGNIAIKVIETPGHTKGGVSFAGDGFILTGDTLFLNSIGRTDLPGGSFKVILDSIKEKIFMLPDSTVVYPGHGEPTTVGREKRENPYINDKYREQ